MAPTVVYLENKVGNVYHVRATNTNAHLTGKYKPHCEFPCDILQKESKEYIIKWMVELSSYGKLYQKADGLECFTCNTGVVIQAFEQACLKYKNQIYHDRMANQCVQPVVYNTPVSYAQPAYTAPVSYAQPSQWVKSEVSDMDCT